MVGEVTFVVRSHRLIHNIILNMKTKISISRWISAFAIIVGSLIGGVAYVMSDDNIYTTEAIGRIEQFGDHYNYDTSYLIKLANTSPEAIRAYLSFTKMGEYTGDLSTEVYFVAALASIYTEDCGECVQLMVHMALEAGVSEDVVRGALQMGGSLSPDLELVRRFATEIATNNVSDNLHEQMLEVHGEAAIADLSICIASNRVYPAMKRALGYGGTSCKVLDFDFKPLASKE